MSGQYDPRSAIKALVDTAKRNQPKIVSSNVSGLVDANEEPIAPPLLKIEGLCILIAALESGSAELPADLQSVELSKAGLLAHVRPDGGVCLGFFGNSRDDAVVVYGDPLMPPEVTKDIVIDFWQRARLGAYQPRLEIVS
jgi:hypothetical protein